MEKGEEGISIQSGNNRSREADTGSTDGSAAENQKRTTVRITAGRR